MEGRQRRSFTEEYKRQAAELVVSSGRSITSVAKELGLRDSVLRRWVGEAPAGAGIGGAAPHHAGDADAGGPGFGDRPAAPGERAAAHGAGHLKKLSSTVARLCGVETALCYPLWLEGSGRSIIGGTIPVKKHGPWVHANLRVVTSPWRRSRLGR